MTLDSRQTVHFPPVEGRAVSARIGSNGPIRVEDKTTLLMAVGYDLLTSISGKPKRRILSQIFCSSQVKFIGLYGNVGFTAIWDF